MVEKRLVARLQRVSTFVLHLLNTTKKGQLLAYLELMNGLAIEKPVEVRGSEK